ncbi:hypothetical protein HDU98_003723, partial [Podochytrium sp. JEL0797]
MSSPFATPRKALFPANTANQLATPLAAKLAPSSPSSPFSSARTQDEDTFASRGSETPLK